MQQTLSSYVYLLMHEAMEARKLTDNEGTNAFTNFSAEKSTHLLRA